MADRTLLHASTSAAFSPEALFSLRQLGDLFARRRVPAENLRVMAGRRKVDLAAVGALDGHWVHPLAMSLLARNNVTTLVYNLEQSVDTLWPFVCDAENWFGDPVAMSAVASFGPRSGLDLHYDHLAVLIVQLEGEKQWTFYGDPVPGPARREYRLQKIEDYPVTGEVLMRPGDVLFLPAGLRHQCEPLGRSLHLGVLVHQLSGVAVAEHLLERARTDEALNELDISPLGAAPPGERSKAYRERLISLVREMDIPAFLAAERLRKARVRRIDWAEDDKGEDTGDLTAELVLSYWPEGLVGKAQARGATVTLTPAAKAIAGALRSGPMSVKHLAGALASSVAPDRFAEALKLLTTGGLVTLGKRSS